MTTTSIFSGFAGARSSSRVIKAPGGGSSELFATAFAEPAPVNGERRLSKASIAASETDSVDGSVFSFPSSVTTPMNGGGYDSDASSVTSSASSSRRGSLQETKSRLFGQNEVPESPRRRVVDRMRSNIFQEPVSTGAAVPVARAPSVKYDHVIDRNPITGEVYNNANRSGSASGRSSAASSVVDGSVGSSASSVASMPTTPVRTRQPPGGRSSNIFG